jgi:hypothetical protein
MKEYMSQDEIRREAEKRGLKTDGNGGYYREGNWGSGFRQDTTDGTVSSGPNGSSYRAYGHNIIDKLDKAAGKK